MNNTSDAVITCKICNKWFKFNRASISNLLTQIKRGFKILCLSETAIERIKGVKRIKRNFFLTIIRIRIVLYFAVFK